MDELVATMHQVWDGKLRGASGPMPALEPRRPGLLFGGFAPASFARAATVGQGWIAPSFGHQALVDGIASIRAAWERVGRADRPRVVVERYFCFGEDTHETARHYLDHYYVDGTDVLADAPTTREHLDAELRRIRDAGADDVILLPCADGPEQVIMLAETLDGLGVPAGPTGRELR